MGNGLSVPSRALRRCVHPKLGGRITVKRPRGDVSPRMCTDEVASARLLLVLVPEHSSSSGGRTRSVPECTPVVWCPGFYFHHSADALSSDDTGPEHIDDDSVPSCTTAVVTQKDESR
jgi:hypothetical protein